MRFSTIIAAAAASTASLVSAAAIPSASSCYGYECDTATYEITNFNVAALPHSESEVVEFTFSIESSNSDLALASEYCHKRGSNPKSDATLFSLTKGGCGNGGLDPHTVFNLLRTNNDNGAFIGYTFTIRHFVYGDGTTIEEGSVFFPKSDAKFQGKGTGRYQYLDVPSDFSIQAKITTKN